MIKPKQLNQLKKYFSTMPVEVVYLFGSQANGKATKLSDADFAVLFKEKLSGDERFDLKLEMTTKLCGILKKERVDVVDLMEAPVAMQYHALFPKNLIFIKNDRRMINFERKAVKMYLD